MINLITSLKETSEFKDVYSWDSVVSWFLRKAFTKKGVESRFVCNDTDPIPSADHTIVVSGICIVRMRSDPAYKQAMRKATKGKVTVYLDAAWLEYDKIYDYIFTVVKPFPRRSAQYVYAGWGADPKYCFPKQTERTVFLDYYQKQKEIWAIYEKVLPSANVKILFHPRQKNLGYLRQPRTQAISWLKMQSELLRKTMFYMETGLGESGLTRIEAAYCGALLVVPKLLYRPLTLATLEHAIWTDEKELRAILKSKTNPMEISRKAHAHTWEKVVERILAKL